MTEADARPVAIVGSGSIGVAFAVVFAGAGRDVQVFDVDETALERAAAELRSRARLVVDAGIVSAANADELTGRVRFTADLGEATAGVGMVQECAPERLELKRDVFARLGECAPGDAVLATSSSALTAGPISEGFSDELASRILVGHPGNPPYLIPVIEVVPSPRTSAATIASARRIYARAGLRPVHVRREVEGFVFNRLQGAVLREAYCLVRDGVIDVDELDEVVRSGLGRRWSFIGPFETSDLNTRGGIASHAEKMGPAYERMGAERGQHDPWTPELVAEVAAQRRRILPLDQWDDRVLWRDEQLAAHARLWEAARR